MADTIKEYVVVIDYEIDEAGAKRANSLFEDLSKIIASLGNVLIQAAGQIQNLVSEATAGASAVSAAGQAMGEATTAATQLAEEEGKAAKAAGENTQAQGEAAAAAGENAVAQGEAAAAAQELAEGNQRAAEATNENAAAQETAAGAGQSLAAANEQVASTAASSMQALLNAAAGAKEFATSHMNAASAVSNFIKRLKEGLAKLRNHGKQSNAVAMEMQKLNKAMSQVVGTARRMGQMALGFIGVSKISSTVEKLREFNFTLAENSKKLKKSLEDTRAYNIALEAMGKDINTINKDKNLKGIFNDLQDIGKRLALPEAAQGQTAIQSLTNELMKLKVVGSYALQWIYYKTQEMAAGPLKEVYDLMTGLREWFAGNIEDIATKAAKGFSWAIQAFASVAKAVKWLLELFDKMPASVKLAFAGLIGYILKATGFIKPMWIALAIVVALIDDFITYMEGGDAALGSFWQPILDYVEKIKPVLSEIVQSFDSLVQKVTSAWENSTGFLDFLKQLAFGGDDFEADASWSDVGKKIWEQIEGGLKQGGDWITRLLFPDGVPPELEGGDWSGLVNKILGKLTAALDITTEIGAGAASFVGDLVTQLINSIITTLDGTDTVDVTDSIANMLNRFIQAGTDNLGKILPKLGTLVKTLMGKIGEVLSNFSEDGVLTTVGKAIVDLLNTALETATALFSGDGFAQLIGGLGDFVRGLFTAIGDMFSKENISEVSGNIKTFVSTLFGSLGKALSGEFGKIGEVDGQKVGADAGDVVTGLLAAILKVPDTLAGDTNVTNFVKTLGEGLKEALGTLGETIGTFAGKIVAWLFSGDAIAAIFSAGQNILKLLVKGIEYGIGAIASFGFNLIDGILEGLGILDPEEKKAYQAALETGEAYKAAITDAFNDGFSFDENDVDINDVNDALMQALALSLTGGTWDDDAFNNLALSIKDKIVKALGREISDDSAAYELNNYIQEVLSNLSAAANQARWDDEIDFTGLDVKEILGPFLDEFGAGAESISEEMYNSIATYLLEGGVDGEKNFLATLFADIISKGVDGAEAELEDGVEKAKEAANEAAEELGMVGEDVKVEPTVDVNAEIDDKGSQKAKEAALKAYEETGKEVTDKANEISAETATAFLAVMNEENGTSMASAFVSGMSSELDKLTDKVKDVVEKINKKLKEIERKIEITFITTGLDEAIEKVISLGEALNSLPEDISINVETSTGSGGDGPKAAMGGIFQSRVDNLTVGEDGEEVIIPLTKQTRGTQLLQYAAERLGITADSLTNANRMLGGNALANRTPAYATTTNTSSVTNNHNVSAPATINVYGKDAKSIAQSVSWNQEHVILRNLKSAFV